MAEITLLDQFTVPSDDETVQRDQMHYIRITVEERSGVAFALVRPRSLTIDEGMGRTTVSCILVVEDLIGSLVNVKPIEGDFIFTIYVGHSTESYRTYKLRLSNIQYDNLNPGESGNFLARLGLVSENWQSVAGFEKNRGWRDKKYSSIVQEIADESNYKNVFIKETDKAIQHTIQPYWSNTELVQWISRRARAPETDSFYTYGVTSDDGFFFVPFTDLIDNPLQGFLGIPPIDPRKFIVSGDREPESNPDERLKVVDIRIESNYIEELNAGASGVRHGYYDFLTGSYVKGSWTYTESNERQLSDWASLSESQENLGSFSFRHRNTNTPDIEKSRVSREVNKIQDVDLTINGVTDIHAGEIVDVMIPVSPEFVTVGFNEFFSGKYIVSSKRTELNLSNSKARTVFVMTRQGINGSNVNTLTQSSTGKDL